MDLHRANVQAGVTSEAVLELGRRYAAQDKFEAPVSIELIPHGWVTASHVTGQSEIPINERVAVTVDDR